MEAKRVIVLEGYEPNRNEHLPFALKGLILLRIWVFRGWFEGVWGLVGSGGVTRRALGGRKVRPRQEHKDTTTGSNNT